MKEYQVSFYINDMYHCYIIDAENESHAKRRVLKESPYPELITNLTAERYYPEW